MKEPYFSVGEEVILCSVNKPELNGECVVLGVYRTHEDQINFFIVRNGRKNASKNPKTICYELSIESISPKGNTILWDESALRKKHKPGDLSLEDMIININEKADLSD